MITVKCYGSTRQFETKEQAIARYYNCLLNSDGSEQRTYADILRQIESGCTYCTDEDSPFGGRVIRY